MVVADPEQTTEALIPEAIGVRVGAVVRKVAKWWVRKSVGVTYVTERWLQAKYPPPLNVPVLVRSNVVLDDEAFVSAPRPASPFQKVQLIAVGHVETRLKGFDFLVRVIAELRSRGVNAKLDIVGDGRAMGEIRSHIAQEDLEGCVELHGYLTSRERLHKVLDSADIFVSGSRAEGLPRAMVEGMARALPVVATRAGGTCELVLPENLVDVDDVTAFCSAIQSLHSSSEDYESASAWSLDRSRAVAEMARPSRLVDFLRQF